MNTLQRLRPFTFLLLLSLTTLYIGCNPPETPEPPAINPARPTNTPNTPFDYIIRVFDDLTGVAIQDARITLELETGAPLTRFTDATGVARFFINDSLTGRPALLTVEKVGYHRYPLNVDLYKDQLPGQVRLLPISSIKASSTPIPTLQPTLLPATSTDTPSPIPATPTPTLAAPTATPPIPTATPTATRPVSTPIPVEGVFAIGLGICDITVYAGPDIHNVRLGDLREGEEAEIIGRTTQSEWLKIVTSRGIEGWINPSSVQITSGNVADVSIDPDWSGPVTPPTSCISPEGGTMLPPNGCVTVHIEKQFLSDDYFDDVLFSWSNVTKTAHYLRLQISGTVDGQTKVLLPASLVEPTAQYLVGRWFFENGGFAHGSEFVYLVTAVDANSNNICSVSGQFTQR